MIVVGLIMALGGMGFLLYGIWTSGKSKSQGKIAADGHAEVEPS